MTKGPEAGRRRAARLPIELDGSLTGRRAHTITALDLSPAGCLVRCDTALEPGSILDLVLRFASEELTAKVRVTNLSMEGASAPPCYLAGLTFLGLSAQAQAALRRFLEDERRRRRRADTPAH
jgi:PilZ domain